MRNTRLAALSFLLTLTSLHAARGRYALGRRGQNEIVVFGGVAARRQPLRPGSGLPARPHDVGQEAAAFGFGRNPFPLPIPR